MHNIAKGIKRKLVVKTKIYLIDNVNIHKKKKKKKMKTFQM
jgi:hypothetical protein